MNFIISVPGKLHCTLEKMTNCPGQSQVTGPGGKFLSKFLRKFIIMGQFRQTNPSILQKRHHKFLKYFGHFLSRTWTSEFFWTF